MVVFFLRETYIIGASNEYNNVCFHGEMKKKYLYFLIQKCILPRVKIMITY